MTKTLDSLAIRTGRFFSQHSVTRKQLNRICMILFVVMMVPLVIISLYNYPADDDFQVALPSATAWLQTGSPLAVFQTIYEQNRQTYLNWQGNFVSGVLCNLSPMIFDMNLYFLSNWTSMALVCLSIAYLLKTLLYWVLNAKKGSFWLIYTPVMILVIQFMPCMGEGFFWHTGSTYLMAFCNMILAVGLLLRTNKPQSTAQKVWRGALLGVSGFMLGASFYGPLLGAFVLLALMCASSFLNKRPSRPWAAITMAFFLLALVINLQAPGIALRQERIGTPNSPAFSVITSILDSFDLIGAWITPQLFAMVMILFPALWVPLRDSQQSFKHPFWFFITLFGMFAATLVPGVYTGSSYGMGRYFNVVYLNFLVLALGTLAYAEGWFIRYLQRRKESEACQQALALAPKLGTRFTALYLSICIVFLTLGGFAFTIMNTSSVNALKALVTGEAAQFHQAMKAREEYISVTDSDEVAVRPLDSQPYVFKPDKLPFQGIYGQVRYMKWYFELFYNAAQSQEAQQSSGVNHAP